MLDVAARRQFPFDTVQMPLNVMDAHHDSFERNVLPMALRQGIGVLGMKPMGDPFILDSKTVTAPEALRYAMSLPVSVTITGIDTPEILDQALRVIRDFTPLLPQERAAMLARTEAAAKDGQFEKYKSSQHFDGTVKNPQWLG